METNRTGSAPGGLRALLQNETLADSLSRQGSPNVARIKLVERPDGGYRWTSVRGEDLALSSGTLAGLEVVASLHRPVDLVIKDTLKPRLRETILKETIYA